MNARVIETRWVLVLLAAVGIIVSLGIHVGEFHFFGDEMRHAMSGVFFRDLLVDFPWRNPVQYALEYYAKYPALGILYWPPFFYFVEGLFFLVFGINVVASRLSILAFALLAVYFWLRIAERNGPRYRAYLSALIFPLLPFMLTYERVTMLEIPALALSLGAIHYWQKFREEEKPRHLWLLALYLVLSLYTSQKALFVPALIVVHFLFSNKFRLLKRWDVWVAGALSIACVLPWYILTINRLALSYERAVGQGFAHMSKGLNWSYYLHFLPEQMGHGYFGVAMLCLAIAGVVWALLRSPRENLFFLLWVFGTYAFFTPILEKSSRHSMYWIPPLVYFALMAVEVLFLRKKAAQVAAAALALAVVFNAARFETQKIAGVDELARFVVAQPESDILYYQGFLNGNFIFHARKYDPQKSHYVAREKQVVAVRVYAGYGQRQVLKTPEEVLEFFKSWGIRYVMIENFEFFAGLGPVRKALQSGEFELLRIFPIWSSHENLRGRRVYLYRYKGPLQRTVRFVELPMLTLRDDIQADLDRLAGRPWPN
ncbi:MAG TPA: glycosyltransferase family 39 protein [Candidatus Nitrosotenuis sp.]|nr:glycosyltransferase family 39 protein [Candidatus Nitrosotenuis sp.]